MELFLSTITSSLTPQIIFAMLGGIVGALIASDFKRYGWLLSCLFIFASIAMAASAGEYLQQSKGIQSIWLLLVLNIPLGMVVGATLDVIRIVSPSLIERLVVNVGNSGVNIVAESFIIKLSKLLGVEAPEVIKDPPTKEYRAIREIVDNDYESVVSDEQFDEIEHFSEIDSLDTQDSGINNSINNSITDIANNRN